MKYFKYVLIGAALLVITACNNGGGGSPPGAAPVANAPVSFIGFLQQMVAAQPEDALPVAVDNLPVDLPEDAQPFNI